ncbi:hypothetical protein D3C81_2020770 [compost metagenome]
MPSTGRLKRLLADEDGLEAGWTATEAIELPLSVSVEQELEASQEGKVKTLS